MPDGPAPFSGPSPRPMSEGNVSSTLPDTDTRILDLLPQAVVVLDDSGGAVAWNDAALRFVGRDDDAMAGAAPPFIGPDAVFNEHGGPVPPLGAGGRAALSALGEQRLTQRRVRGDGSELWTETSFSAHPGGGLVCTMTDVTARVKVATGAAAERDLERRALDGVDALVVVLDTGGHVLRMNRRAREVLVMGEHEVGGKDFFATAITEDDQANGRLAFWRRLSGMDEGAAFDAAVRTRTGEDKPVRWRLVPVLDADGTASAAVCTGEEAGVQAEGSPSVVLYDELTGLPTRDLFDAQLGTAIARARRNETGLALLLFELDGFTTLQDTVGDEASRRVLREVAERLRQVTRANDMVARLGGDQFAVLLTDLDTPRDDAGTVATRMAAATLMEPFGVLGSEIDLSASVGASLFPTDAYNVDDLLAHAGVALAEAKRRRNRTTDVEE